MKFLERVYVIALKRVLIRSSNLNLALVRTELKDIFILF